MEDFKTIYDASYRAAHIQDVQLWTSSVDETEPDRFILLSDYTSSFMMMNINAADTNSNR